MVTLVFLGLGNQITSFVVGIPADSVQQWNPVLNRETCLPQAEALRAMAPNSTAVLALSRTIGWTQRCTKLTSRSGMLIVLPWRITVC
jgi:hypothetical protein